MKIVLDELGMSTLVTEPVSLTEFTLLRFPYTTFLCTMASSNEVSDKILRHQNITDPRTIKDIKETAAAIAENRVLYPDHYLSTALTVLHCEELFGEGKLRLSDRYFDSDTTILFYHPLEKGGFIPPPNGASELVLKEWQKPKICYFQCDHYTSHIHCMVGEKENFVLDATMSKTARMIVDKIDKIESKHFSEVEKKNRNRGKGGMSR